MTLQQTMNLFDIDDSYPVCSYSRIPARRVVWGITSICNRHCYYCFAMPKENQKSRIHLELSTLEILDAAQKLKQLGFSDIYITGGEPFVRKDMIGITQELSQMGFTLAISTNCDLIHKADIHELIKLNLRSINVSLDSHIPSINDSVRGKDSFKNTINIIKLLVDKPVRLRVHTVLTKLNRSHIDSVSRFLYRIGVNLHAISAPSPFLEPYDADLSKRLLTIREECAKMEIQYLRIKLFPNQKPYYWTACSSGSNLLYISSDGSLMPCNSFLQQPSYSSNISKDELASITSYLVQLDTDSKAINKAPCTMPYES